MLPALAWVHRCCVMPGEPAVSFGRCGDLGVTEDAREGTQMWDLLWGREGKGKAD